MINLFKQFMHEWRLQKKVEEEVKKQMNLHRTIDNETDALAIRLQNAYKFGEYMANKNMSIPLNFKFPFHKRSEWDEVFVALKEQGFKIVPPPEITKLFEYEGVDGGMIRLETWPEGLVLWVNGKIKYKFWEDSDK